MGRIGSFRVLKPNFQDACICGVGWIELGYFLVEPFGEVDFQVHEVVRETPQKPLAFLRILLIHLFEHFFDILHRLLDLVVFVGLASKLLQCDEADANQK